MNIPQEHADWIAAAPPGFKRAVMWNDNNFRFERFEFGVNAAGEQDMFSHYKKRKPYTVKDLADNAASMVEMGYGDLPLVQYGHDGKIRPSMGGVGIGAPEDEFVTVGVYGFPSSSDVVWE
jgi:hypothetical protein